MKHHHSILSLCEALEASASGYYDWHERRLCPGPRALENQALAKEIKQLHQASRQTYGSPRIVMPNCCCSECAGRVSVAILSQRRRIA